MKLLGLDFQDTLPFNVALEQLVKIYSVDTYFGKFSEESELDAFSMGEIKIINGTIIQKVLRYKNYCLEASINNILLLSLPITSPYKVLDKNKRQQNESMEVLREPGEEQPKEPMLLGNLSSEPEELYFPISRRESHLQRDQMATTVMMNSKIQEKSKVRFPEELYISLDQLSFVKKQFTSYVKDHIRKNQIELIFSTETIPSSLFEELKEAGVVVIFPVSEDEMKLLSLVLKAKIINNVALLTQDLSSEYLGNIKSYYLANLLDSETEAYHTSLIFLDRLEPVTNEFYNSLGVAIYSNDKAKNVQLKNFLRENLVYIYFSLTEHELVIREREATASLFPDIQIDYSRVGDFGGHLQYEVANLRQILKSRPEVLEYTVVEVENMNTDNSYPDISSDFSYISEKFFSKITAMEGLKNVHDISNRIQRSIQSPQEFDNFYYLFNTELDFLASLNTSKNDRFVLITSTPEKFCHLPYSDKDVTLSKYLTKKLQDFESLDLKVKEKWSKRTMVYIAGSCIKIHVSQVEKELTGFNFLKQMVGMNKKAQLEKGLFYYNLYMLRSTKRMVKSGIRTPTIRSDTGKKVKITAEIERINKNRNSNSGPFERKLEAFPNPTPNHKLTVPHQQNSRNSNSPAIVNNRESNHPTSSEESKLAIKSYVLCSTCGKVLSDPIYLDSIHKNISFMMFLFSFSQPKPSRRDSKVRIRSDTQFHDFETTFDHSGPDDFCSHAMQTRGFVLGNTIVKMTRYDVKPFKLVHFHHRDYLMSTNNIINEAKRCYEGQKLKIEDKVGAEIGEFLIRQSSLLVYLLRDLIAKGSGILANDRIMKNRNLKVRYELLQKLLHYYSKLAEIVNKTWFVMVNFRNIQLRYRVNHLLRGVMIGYKSFDAVIKEMNTLLVRNTKMDRKALAFHDVVVSVCSMIKEVTYWGSPKAVINNEKSRPMTLKPKESGVILKDASFSLREGASERDKDETTNRGSLKPVSQLRKAFTAMNEEELEKGPGAVLEDIPEGEKESSLQTSNYTKRNQSLVGLGLKSKLP